MAPKSATAKRFRWVIPNFEGAHQFYSPEFGVREFQWRMEIRKKVSASVAKMLQIYLHRMGPEEYQAFPCMASASVKLLSYDENVEPYRCLIPAQEFGESRMKYANVLPLHDVIDPAKRYMQNDEIVLEVQVMASLMQKMLTTKNTMLEILSNNNAEIHLRLNLAGIDNQMMALQSPIFSHCDAKWQICVHKNDDALGIYLEPIQNDQLKCDYDARVKIEVGAVDPEYDNYIKTIVGRIDQNNRLIGCQQLIEWNTLIDAFTHQTAMTLTIHFSANVDHDRQLGEINCPVCFENLRNQRVKSIKCGHIFCEDCMEKGVRPRKKCAVCNAKVVWSQIRNIFLP